MFIKLLQAFIKMEKRKLFKFETDVFRFKS